MTTSGRQSTDIFLSLQFIVLYIIRMAFQRVLEQTVCRYGKQDRNDILETPVRHSHCSIQNRYSYLL